MPLVQHLDSRLNSHTAAVAASSEALLDSIREERRETRDRKEEGGDEMRRGIIHKYLLAQMSVASHAPLRQMEGSLITGGGIHILSFS